MSTGRIPTNPFPPYVSCIDTTISHPINPTTMTSYVTLSDPDINSKIADEIKLSLLQYRALQPKNTTLAYEPKQREWREWCSCHFGPIPSTYDPKTWEGTLPGDLVDEGKLFLFIKEVTARAPKTGKRVARQKGGKRAAIEDSSSITVAPAPKRPKGQPCSSLPTSQVAQTTETDLLIEREGSLPPLVKDDDEEEGRITLMFNTVRQYVAAVQRLYEEQKSQNLNLARHPQGLSLKALKTGILQQTSIRKRSEYTDRGEATLKDNYRPGQIPLHTKAVWQMVKKGEVAKAFRTGVDFLFGNHMLLRSSNRLALELADCFSLELPNEGAGSGPSVKPTRALVVILDQGKTNQHGRVEYGAALRHKDPAACLIGQLAFLFFWRWQVDAEPFPRFQRSEEWYEIKVLHQSTANRLSKLSPQTAGQWTRRLYNACGIKTSKTTHAPRSAGSQNADIAGVSEAQVSYYHLYLYLP